MSQVRLHRPRGGEKSRGDLLVSGPLVDEVARHRARYVSVMPNRWSPVDVCRVYALVNINSAGAMKGYASQLPYTAAKHSVVGLSPAMANELAAQDIRVDSVRPTGVPTGMIPPSFGVALGDERTDLVPDFVNAMPTLRVEPVDVSNAVLLLISDESRYVTRLQFEVDAGVTIN